MYCCNHIILINNLITLVFLCMVTFSMDLLYMMFYCDEYTVLYSLLISCNYPLCILVLRVGKPHMGLSWSDPQRSVYMPHTQFLGILPGCQLYLMQVYCIVEISLVEEKSIFLQGQCS